MLGLDGAPTLETTSLISARSNSLIEQIGDWVSADRSVRGDAHVVTDAGTDDAWLAVHVVGALVLRLGSRL